MKKFLCIILVLSMLLALCACGKKDTPASTNPPVNNNEPGNTDNKGPDDSGDVSYPATPNMNPDGSPNLDKIGNFDANYDYSQNPRFSVSYHCAGANALTQQAADAYEHWCSKMNLKWEGLVSCNNDSELLLTNIQAYVDQGCDILIIDANATMYDAIAEQLEPYADKVVWMTHMMAPRSGTAGDGDLLTAFVGFDYIRNGEVCAEKLIEWKDATYPNVPWSEFGVIGFTITTVPELGNREVGARNVFMKHPELPAENYFTIDLVGGGGSMQSAIDKMTPVIAEHDDIRHWLVAGLVDQYAQGASIVLEQTGMTDTSCVVCIGGAELQTQLDAGTHSAFRYALFTPGFIYSEYVLCALYAFKMGWATPDTIWPQWVKGSDHGGEGHTYPNRLLPIWWFDEDNYKQFFSWVDLYAGKEYYGYNAPGVTLDDFSAFQDPPADWANQ